MSIYFIILSSILIVGSISNLIENRDKNKKILCVLFFTVLFLVSILRDESVGADVLVYKFNFDIIKNMKFPTISYMGWESGFVLLNNIVGIISDSFRMLMVVIAFFVIFNYTKFIYINSINITLSFFLLITLNFFDHSLNIYRQVVALGIILKSIEYIKKEEGFKFIISILIATFFHNTAIIFSIMYFVRNLKLNLKRIFIILSISPVALISINVFINLITKFGKYSLYRDNMISGEGYKILIVYIIIFIFVYSFRTNVYLGNSKEENIMNNLMYFSSIITIVLQILAFKFSLFSRINIYFSIFLIILIPNCIQRINDINLRVFVKICIVIAFISFYYITCRADVSSIVPYIFNNN